MFSLRSDEIKKKTAHSHNLAGVLRILDLLLAQIFQWPFKDILDYLQRELNSALCFYFSY